MANHVNEDQMELEHLIVTPKLTIEALRDSGYKSTDHALAELLDNSIEAKANYIEVFAIEDPPDPNIRYARSSVSQIAVSDNGIGMASDILRRALIFGDGTRLEGPRRGIGRFGIGLPQSSISQCRRVDIWTWQNGIDNARHCYLDLDEIQFNDIRTVPEPTDKPLPPNWREFSANTDAETGTIVIWSELDRVRWSGAGRTLERTEELCGRIYRKFLTREQSPINIKLIKISNENNHWELQEEKDCLPNDPLYLLSRSSTPEPFHDRPMFKWHAEHCWTIPLDNGEEGKVNVRCSMATVSAINHKQSDVPWPKIYNDPGKAPWGKHAHHNLGVSIVRAERELEMSEEWVNTHEPTERWWSVEVEFDPCLDEIFGVTNNKQHAYGFTAGAKYDSEEEREADETHQSFMEKLRENNDPKIHLIEIWSWMNKQISQMRELRKASRKGTRTRHPDLTQDLESTVTSVINQRRDEGYTGESDKAPKINRDKKHKILVESMINFKIDHEHATQWAKDVLDNNQRTIIKSIPFPSDPSSFFSVNVVNDVLELWINISHPAYNHLIGVLNDEGIDNEDRDKLIERIHKANFTIQMLLAAWARYEDEEPLGPRRDQVQQARSDWGRVVKRFLEDLE